MELFRIIEGFENYEISKLGNVRNRTTNKVLKCNLDGNGYYIIRLWSNKKATSKCIHRLIGETFIPNPDNKAFIDHKDGNIINNAIENLRWATSSENQMNVKISKRNSSGVKGVSWDSKAEKWRSRINIDGVSVHIGRYGTIDTIEEAIQARQIRANEAFGVFTNACEKL